MSDITNMTGEQLVKGLSAYLADPQRDIEDAAEKAATDKLLAFAVPHLGEPYDGGDGDVWWFRDGYAIRLWAGMPGEIQVMVNVDAGFTGEPLDVCIIAGYCQWHAIYCEILRQE